jgi:hypothetical protein
MSVTIMNTMENYLRLTTPKFGVPMPLAQFSVKNCLFQEEYLAVSKRQDHSFGTKKVSMPLMPELTAD